MKLGAREIWKDEDVEFTGENSSKALRVDDDHLKDILQEVRWDTLPSTSEILYFLVLPLTVYIFLVGEMIGLEEFRLEG